MMIEIQCPKTYTGSDRSLFLAGGITSCKNWQDEVVDLLESSNLVLFNPRRKNYDLGDSELEKDQIFWEYNYLNKSDAVLFWFPSDTDCPITLYELGKVSAGNKKIFVGVDPDYSRKTDVVVQTGLIRSDIEVVFSIGDLIKQVLDWEDGK